MSPSAPTSHVALTATRATPVAQLVLSGVTKAYGDRLVLDQVSFSLRPGDKAAVIGENGSGKSTLLRLIAGTESPDHGHVTLAFPGGTGHLGQTLALGPRRTVQDAVDLALHELRTWRPASTPPSTPSPTPAPPSSTPTGNCSRPSRTGTATPPTPAPTRPCTHSASDTSAATAPWARSPAANSPGSPWPAYSAPHPNSCSWTSRPTTSTRPPWPGSRTGCARTAARSSSSPTTGPSWTPWPPPCWRWTGTGGP